MATVRVYVVTYRRPLMLRRALNSLRSQTCTDWICELHNDDPADLAPGKLVDEFGDPRIVLHQHERNLGALTTFDLVYAGAPEPYFSLLEDDNWWEPVFLERLLAVLAVLPAAEVAWANMRVWRESAGGWSDTGRTVWPVIARPHVSIAWPQLLQFAGPLHSNGAMLARSSAAGPRWQTGVDLPFDVNENMRERAFRYPVILVPEPLANFAITLQTARTPRLDVWVASQALFGAAFLKHVPLSPAERAALWAARRASTPPATSALFFAAWLQPTRGFLGHARPQDWWRFFRGCLRRPSAALAALRARRRQFGLWTQIDRATAAACARPQSPADVLAKRLACRADLARSTCN